MQKFFSLIVVLVIGIVGTLFGKDILKSIHEKSKSADNEPKSTRPSNDVDARPIVRGEKLNIASFNIKVFGDKKAADGEVMRSIAQVISHFDIIAIQEIKTQNAETILNDFLRRINEQLQSNPNSKHAHYDYIISERLGYTNSKEQYAFIYDASRVEVDRDGAYVVNDPPSNERPHGWLHREPLVAQFRVRGQGRPLPSEAFTFILVNIHTDPDVAKEEVDILASVYRAVKQHSRSPVNGIEEDDVIILGDLNVNDKQLGELGKLPDILPVIRDTYTNVLQTAQYDNIILNQRATSEFTGRGGVFDMVRMLNITESQAAKVSDHLPVWAEFEVYESDGQTRRIATVPTEADR